MMVSSLRSFTDSVTYLDLYQISQRSVNVADPLRTMSHMYTNTSISFVINTPIKPMLA